MSQDRDERLRHLIIAAVPCRGPRPDVDRFVPLLEQALSRVGIGAALADAGYDSEPNHATPATSGACCTAIPATAGRPEQERRARAGKYRQADEAAAGQALPEIRAEVAGGDGHEHDQAPPRLRSSPAAATGASAAT